MPASGCLELTKFRAQDRLVPALRSAVDTLVIHRWHREWLAHKIDDPHTEPMVVITHQVPHHVPHQDSLALRFGEYAPVPGISMG